MKWVLLLLTLGAAPAAAGVGGLTGTAAFATKVVFIVAMTLTLLYFFAPRFKRAR